MSTRIYPSQNTGEIFPILRQVLTSFILGGVIFIVLLLAFFIGYQVWYAGRIFNGVTLSGMDLSGLTVSQAQQRIAAQITYPQSGLLTLTDGTSTWQATPQQLGLFLDAEASAQTAFNLGRNGSLAFRAAEQFGAASFGRTLSPALILDERITFDFINNLATQIDVSPVEASIQIQGTDVVVNPGQTGHILDRYAALDSIRSMMLTQQSGTLALPIIEAQPAILDASAQADLARQILSQPLSITLPPETLQDAGPWVFNPSDLAQMLAFERVTQDGQTTLQVSLDRDYLRSYLADLAPTLTLAPANTRFMFNDDTRLLEVVTPAVIGRTLDLEASLNAILTGVSAGEHTISLIFQYAQPQVTDDMTGEELGITELVHTETSYFRGSSAARVQNIRIASSNFYGLLIPPGATFSMADAMSDVTLDNGYAEALIIVGDRTVRGVGGGVCQVSTTLFRAAFFAGFPIVERHAHAYRVGYYEQTSGGHSANLAGLDATVYVPLVDLRFVNDTPYWLLMETYINTSNYSLTWKFYSTSDGRSVDYTTTGPTNTVEPPEDTYRENPELNMGEIVQVDWAAQGADVTINRTVYRNGAVYFTDTFFTRYQAWGNVYEYGPGTELPSPTASGE